jgi:hypothetical protein
VTLFASGGVVLPNWPSRSAWDLASTVPNPGQPTQTLGSRISVSGTATICFLTLILPATTPVPATAKQAPSAHKVAFLDTLDICQG